MKETINNYAGASHQQALLLKERIIEIENPKEYSFFDLYSLLQKNLKDIDLRNVIKFNLIKSSKLKLYFQVISLEGLYSFLDQPFSPNRLSGFDLNDDKRISCLIIPTGIGARYGGYAGDANPIAKILSYGSNYLLTHPNVVNGAVLTDPPANLICLEGYLLDQFLLGQICIVPTRENMLGVIFDQGISDKRLEYEISVLNALRVFYGCKINAIAITEKPLIIESSLSEHGFSTGKIKNLEYLIEKAIRLKNLGSTAIAICTSINDLELNPFYMNGKGVDPIGGIEAIISRSVSFVTGLPSAHAPVLVGVDLCVYPNVKNIDFKQISPLSASEYIACTFLPSVISSLRFAPKVVLNNDLDKNPHFEIQNLKSYLNLSKIIVPYNAFGGLGVLFQNEVSQNVVLVKENKTCLDINPTDVNANFNLVSTYENLMNSENILKLGIDESVLKRPVENIPILY